MTRSNLKNRSRIVKQLDSIFSQYIRLRHSQDGMAVCVTCQKRDHWKGLQCGHFYSRGRQSTRWDENNCWPQCVSCNVFLKGNYINYTKYMIDKYGREFVDELEIKSKQSNKLSTVSLLEMIEKYKNLVKNY